MLLGAVLHVAATAVARQTQEAVPAGVKCEAWCNKWTLGQPSRCGDCEQCDEHHCASYKGAAPANSGDPEGCDCEWTASGANCGQSDGSLCWTECCGTRLHARGGGGAQPAASPAAWPSFASGELPQFGALGDAAPSGSAVGPVPGAVADAPLAGWAIEHDECATRSRPGDFWAVLLLCRVASLAC